MTRVALVMALKPTPHGTSWRQPCSTSIHVPKVWTISCPFMHRSSPGKVPRVSSN